MQNTIGLIKEKLGRTVNKAYVLRYIGTIETEVSKGKNKKTGKMIRTKAKIPRYRAVARHYFSDSETMWQCKKLDRAFELYRSDEIFALKNVHFQFIDFDTGNTLNIGVGQIGSRENPISLDERIEQESIKTFVRQNKPAIAWVFLAVGIICGVFIGFTIGQNAEGIMEGIKQASNGIQGAI